MEANSANAANAVEEYGWFVRRGFIVDYGFSENADSLSEEQYRMLAHFYYIGAYVHQDLYKAMEYYKLGKDWSKVDEIEGIIAEYNTQINDSTSGMDRAMKLFDKARRRLNEGDPEDSLTNARKCIEAIVKKLAALNNLANDTRETDLMDIIDSLKENGVISEFEASMMHKTRKAANDAVHEGKVPTMDEARPIIDMLAETIKSLDLTNSERLSTATIQQSNPVGFEDYYSRSRLYFGKWSKCYTRSSLLQIPEFISLKDKADKGDIAAMIDIACGFLTDWSKFSEAGLVNFPSFTYKGIVRNTENCYDLRYYYWILKACSEATSKIYSYRKFLVPMKYMPTVFLEGLKFDYFFFNRKYNLVAYEINNTPGSRYMDQVELVEEMFGTTIYNVAEDTQLWPVLLKQFFIEYEGQRIIHPIHRESTPQDIDVLVKCDYFKNNTSPLEPWAGSEYSDINNEDDLQAYLQSEYENTCSLIAKDLLELRHQIVADYEANKAAEAQAAAEEAEQAKKAQDAAFKKKLKIGIPVFLLVAIIAEQIGIGKIILVLILAVVVIFAISVLKKAKDDDNATDKKNKDTDQ